MPRTRPVPDIPAEPLGRYVLGELTLLQLARLIDTTQDNARLALHALGVDTTPSARKRRCIARRAEAAARLPAGGAYGAAADLYREGATLQDVGDLLGCSDVSAGNILRRGK